jgi:hypothetical protein
MYKKNTSLEAIPHFSVHKGFVILSVSFFFQFKKVICFEKIKMKKLNFKNMIFELKNIE